MEEAIEDVGSNTTNVSRGIGPRLYNSGHSVSHDDHSEVPSGLVQDEVEMVFAQERMRWVRSPRVIEHLILVMRVDNFR